MEGLLGLFLVIVLATLILVALLSESPGESKLSAKVEDIRRLEYEARKEIHEVSAEHLQRVTEVLQDHAQGKPIDKEVLDDQKNTKPVG